MKTFLFTVAVLLAFVCPAVAGEHAATVGYGFGAPSDHNPWFKVENDRHYDFSQVSYLFEQPFRNAKVAFTFEPFAAYVHNPNDGLDVGFTVGIKWYPFAPGKGLYLGPQVGVAYTTVKFEEQGTHLLFILQGTIGFRYRNFFIEDRFKHYSNGHTASPNRSVHSNIIAVGMYF